MTCCGRLNDDAWNIQEVRRKLMSSSIFVAPFRESEEATKPIPTWSPGMAIFGLDLLPTKRNITMVRTLQPLLGVNKSNPFLELLIDPQCPEHILVHFGMHLLEKVRRDRSAVELKMLAGRLYNTGFNRAKLCEHFGWTRKTIQSFGEALKSGDVDEMRRVFAGRWNKNKKLTKEREQFVRETYRDIYKGKGCHSNAAIRAELKRKLSATVSRETLRPIINDEKARIEATEQQHDRPLSHSGGTSSSCFLPVLRAEQQAMASGVQQLFAALIEISAKTSKREIACKKWSPLSTDLPQKRKIIPSAESFVGSVVTCTGKTFGVPRFVHHAGLLLVRMDIDRVTEGLPERDSLRQWLGSVLCGAVNIEQTGELSFEALEVLIGPTLRSAYRQRLRLHDICDTELTMSLWRRNAELIGATGMNIFLYDPHGIHYTGALRILLGWLGNLHMVGKVYYQDFFHTEQGLPVIAFLEDNYENMRERFSRQVDRLRQLLWGTTKHKITIVADRAIYDQEDMLAFRQRDIHIITWQKGGGDIAWQPPDIKNVCCFSIVRCRNNSRDTVTCQIEYYREDWAREPSIQCIIVRISKDNEIAPKNLAVLCTDPDIAAEAALRPILRRWLQENDMRHAIPNFGINQITSYGSVSYRDIANTLEDRLVPNPQLRRLTADRLELKKKWGLELVKRQEHQQRADEFVKNKKQKLETVETKITEEDDTNTVHKLRKCRSKIKQSLRAKTKRDQDALDNSREIEQKLTTQISEINEKMTSEATEVSRLEDLIKKEYCKLKFGPKALFDAVRMTARNIFAQIHAVFRPLLDNRRNDCRLLRELIRSPGMIFEDDHEIVIVLVLSRQYQPKVRVAVEQLLDKISVEASNHYPGKSVRFRLQNFGPSP